MINLESAKTNALWPNESLNFPFYETFSNCIPNWTTFDLMIFFRKWDKDCFVTKWRNLYVTFPNRIPKWTSFVEEVFWFSD